LYCFLTNYAYAQQWVKGVVYDTTKINLVEGVKIVAKSGTVAYTDSMGAYKILIQNNDSLTFFYKGKPTQKFATNNIYDPEHFNIQLLVKIKTKYATLKEVVVYGKTYRQDSMENRERYKEIFNYETGLSTSVGADGGVGFDIGALINMFRFRRNKQIREFRKYLVLREQDKYIDHRFSKRYVSRVTGLKDAALDNFLLVYKPDYTYLITLDDVGLTQYILAAQQHYNAKQKK
jgi:hypothetical protein